MSRFPQETLFRASPNDFISIIRRFEDNVLDHPEKIAIHCHPIDITYYQLNQECNYLAQHVLTKLGPSLSGKVKVIGILLEPYDYGYIRALISIWKMGFTVLLLDPNFSDENLSKRINISGVSCIITTHEGKTRLSKLDLDHAVKCLLSEEAAISEEKPIENINIRIDPSQLAYFAFTSGTTGDPKCVGVPHEGILGRIQDHIKRLNISSQDRVFQFANLCFFDPLMVETLMALLAGGVLVLPENSAAKQLNHLPVTCNQSGVTIAILSPKLLQRLDPKKFKTLRVVLTTGEEIRQSHLKHWRARDIGNGYGPCELGVGATLYRMSARDFEEREDGKVPIDANGEHFFSELTYYIENSEGEFGKEGQGILWVGGKGIARGYYKKGKLDETLTNEKFRILDGLSADDRAMVFYNTGDIVNKSAEKMYFVGRKDHQANIGGVRIELDAIRERIKVRLTHSTLDVELVEVWVDYKEDQSGDMRLIAYLCLPQAQADFPNIVHDQIIKALLGDGPKVGYDIPEFFYWILRDEAIDFSEAEVGAISEYFNRLPGDLIQEVPRIIKHYRHAPGEEVVLFSLEEEVMVLFEDVLEYKGINIGVPFEYLGGTSLKWHMLDKKLYDVYGISINGWDREAITIANIARTVFHTRLFKNAFIRFDEETPEKPNKLFVLPPVDGSMKVFERISEGVSAKCSVHVLVLPLLNRNLLEKERDFYIHHAAITDLELMASYVVAAIRQIQPEGPYNLMGWSFGGLLAYEVGCQLVQNNQQINFLGIIDSQPPNELHFMSRAEHADRLRYLINKIIDKDCNLIPSGFEEYCKKAQMWSKQKQIRDVFSLVLNSANAQHYLDKYSRLDKKSRKDYPYINIIRALWKLRTARDNFLATLNYETDDKPQLDNVTIYIGDQENPGNGGRECCEEGWAEFVNQRSYGSKHYPGCDHFTILNDPRFIDDVLLQVGSQAQALHVDERAEGRLHSFKENYVNCCIYSEFIEILGLPSILFPIDETFVNLVIVMNQEASQQNDESTSKTFSEKMVDSVRRSLILQSYEADLFDEGSLIAVEDVFQKKSVSSDPIKKVLISGYPGIGKTTLCHYILTRWLKGNLWNDRFEVVLFISLKKLQGYLRSPEAKKAIIRDEKKDVIRDTRFRQYVFKYCVSDEYSDDDKSALWGYVKAVPEKVLYVVDGYDELIDEDAKEFVKKHILFLKFSSIIITSRPYGVDTFLLQFQQQHLMTKGFTDENISVYIDRVFSDARMQVSQNDIQELKCFLGKNSNANRLARVPLCLSLMSSIWRTERNQQALARNTRGGSSESLRNIVTLTQLYKKLLTYLLQWALSKYVDRGGVFTSETNQSIFEYADRYLLVQHPISRLCYFFEFLAYKTLSGISEYTFSGAIVDQHYNAFCTQVQSEFQVTDEDLRACVFDSGFLVVGNDGGKGWNAIKIEFVHLTFQDYLAARYIVKHLLSADDIGKELRRWLIEIKYEPRYQCLIRFIAGCFENKYDKFEQFLNVLCEGARAISGHLDIALFLSCFEEAQYNYAERDSSRPACNELLDWIDKYILTQFTIGDIELLTSAITQSPRYCRQSVVFKELLRKGLRSQEYRKRRRFHDLYLLLFEHDVGFLEELVEVSRSPIEQISFNAAKTLSKLPLRSDVIRTRLAELRDNNPTNESILDACKNYHDRWYVKSKKQPAIVTIPILRQTDQLLLGLVAKSATPSQKKVYLRQLAKVPLDNMKVKKTLLLALKVASPELKEMLVDLIAKLKLDHPSILLALIKYLEEEGAPYEKIHLAIIRAFIKMKVDDMRIMHLLAQYLNREYLSAAIVKLFTVTLHLQGFSQYVLEFIGLKSEPEPKFESESELKPKPEIDLSNFKTEVLDQVVEGFGANAEVTPEIIAILTRVLWDENLATKTHEKAVKALVNLGSNDSEENTFKPLLGILENPHFDPRVHTYICTHLVGRIGRMTASQRITLNQQISNLYSSSYISDRVTAVRLMDENELFKHIEVSEILRYLKGKSSLKEVLLEKLKSIDLKQSWPEDKNKERRNELVEGIYVLYDQKCQEKSNIEDSKKIAANDFGEILKQFFITDTMLVYTTLLDKPDNFMVKLFQSVAFEQRFFIFRELAPIVNIEIAVSFCWYIFVESVRCYVVRDGEKSYLNVYLQKTYEQIEISCNANLIDGLVKMFNQIYLYNILKYEARSCLVRFPFLEKIAEDTLVPDDEPLCSVPGFGELVSSQTEFQHYLENEVFYQQSDLGVSRYQLERMRAQVSNLLWLNELGTVKEKLTLLPRSHADGQKANAINDCFLRIRFAIAAGEYDQLENLFSQTEPLLQPDQPWFLARLNSFKASYRLDLGDFEAAAIFYLKSHHYCRQDYTYLLNVGLSYLSLGHFSEASRYFFDSDYDDFFSPTVLACRALLLVHQGKFQEGLDKIELALSVEAEAVEEIFDHDFNVFVKLCALMRKEDYQGVIDTIEHEEGKRIPQKHLLYGFDKARAYVELARYDDAIHILNEILLNNPNHMKGSALRGFALVAKYGDFSKGVSDFERARSWYSENMDLLYYEARALHFCDKYDEAREKIMKILSINASHHEANRLLHTMDAQEIDESLYCVGSDHDHSDVDDDLYAFTF